MILATLCYVKRDGYILMVYRNKKATDIHEGKWNGLGGKFEAGETPEECVIREVYEESGLSIQSPKLCGLIMFPNFMGNDWIENDKLTDLNLWESDHIFFPWI